MRVTRSGLRLSGLVLTIVGAVVALELGVFTPSAPVTKVGEAGVAVGDDTARAVERVAYRQDVIRVGDVVIVDGSPLDPISDPDIAEMWTIVDSVWPDSLDSELRQLSVIEEEPRGLVGVVHPASGGGWILSLDLADLDDRELLVETIVHELSHVVTLDPSVFRFGDGGCDGIRIDLGCASQGSVLARFADRFWSDGIGTDDLADHVNDYAMSGAHEDLAETFTAWVLDWPVDGDTVAAKIALLESDPQLAQLAAELTSSISLDVSAR